MFEITYHFGEFGCVINIYHQRGPGYGWHVAKPIELVFTKLEEGQLHDPTLKMNSMEGGFLIKAFKDAFDKGEDSVAKLQGKIEVMERYIEDLRRLLKVDGGRMIRPEVKG